MFYFRVKKEIRHLENEVSKWQVLADRVRGDVPADFDNQTLAVLRGRLVRYLMRSKEVSPKTMTCLVSYFQKCFLSTDHSR